MFALKSEPFGQGCRWLVMNTQMLTPDVFPVGVVRMTNLRDGCTALHRAAESGQHLAIPMLIEADPRVKDMQNHAGQTALHVACNLMDKKCVAALLVQSNCEYHQQLFGMIDVSCNLCPAEMQCGCRYL